MASSKPAAKKTTANKKPAAKKTTAKVYDVRLRPGFPAPRRVRAGIEVPRGGGVQTELTDEQLKALKADPEIVVREVKASDRKEMVDRQDAKES